MRSVLSRTVLACAVALMPLAVPAQGTGIAFSGLQQDTSLPVEVQADQLSVNQSDGTAVFSGNVQVVQGEMRLTAATVLVEYVEAGGSIASLHASGGVTFVNAAEAAESREAVYTIDSGQVVMTGDVILTQGSGTIAGQKLTISLTDGTGTMEGRVETVFTPGSSE